jgi:DNA mismatch repair protein MutS
MRKIHNAELKEYETLVLNAEETIREVENRLFKEVCNQLSKAAPRLLKSGRILAELDVLASFAEVAVNRGYCRPN